MIEILAAAEEIKKGDREDVELDGYIHNMKESTFRMNA
jgi:hypothetical protein